ncbi:MAG: addiction module toxin RelE [archaeon]|jgi:mRNA-degrading endonuclease RelE of RelBE toxin-antitoxin system
MNYTISKLLEKKINKIRIKNKTQALILNKKMQEIILSDTDTIEHYKNLKFPMQNQKRVYIDSSFVLTFEFDQNKDLIIFVDFDHHDKIYKRK